MNNLLVIDNFMILKKYLSAFLVSVVSVLVFCANLVSAATTTVDDLGCGEYFGGRGMMSGFGWDGGYGMMNWSGSGSGWGILVMILAIALWVIFWAVVIVATVALVRWLYMKVFKAELWIFGKKETPEDVLKMRFAKGDISKEQYEAIKKEIAH